MRTLFLCTMLLSAAQLFAAEPVLVPLKDSDLQQVRITTFSGDEAGTISPMVPSSEITVAIFGETLLPGDADEIREKLIALHAALKRKQDLYLISVSSGGVEQKGPFPTRRQLQMDLRSLSSGADTDGKGEALTLLGSLTQLPGKWSHLLVIGHFPEPDSRIRDYAAAYLSNHFRAARMRFSYWTPGELPPPVFSTISAETGGIASLNSPSDLLSTENDSSAPWAELQWVDPQLKSGFHLYEASIEDSRLSEKHLAFSSFATARGVQLPSIAGYLILREDAAALTAIRQQPAIKPDALDKVRHTLNEALAINPSDREALAAAADIFEKGGSLEEAAVYLESLSELLPSDGDLYARLGDLHFAVRNYAAAEPALMKAWNLHSQQRQVAKKLGYIAAEKGDDRKALSFFEESLKAKQDDAETWFLRASSANRLKDWVLEADSLEHGLILQPVQLIHRTTLVRLFIGHKEYEKAVRYIQPVLDEPPPDSAVRADYAGFLEKAGQPESALVLWKGALELDPKLEPAYYGIAHILFDKGDFAGCIRTADEGIGRVSPSARLYASKADAQERLRLWYGARRTLQRGSAALNDPDFLRRFAQTEDQYGDKSGPAYQQALIACEAGKEAEGGQNCLALMQRGLMVSLRDGDPNSAEWFAAKLRSVGRSDLTAILTQRVAPKSEVWVPGGTGTILRLVGEKLDVPREDFLKEFSKAVLLLETDKPSREALVDAIVKNFEIIHELDSYGKRDGDTVNIELSVSDSASVKRTQKILKLLGWEMEDSEIRPAKGTSAAKRQQISASLALDEIGMQEALKARKPFVLHIADDWVPASLGEALWRDQFYRKRNFLGGFTQALAEDLDLAKLYVGISELDEATAEELIKDFGIKTLHDKYADLLFNYSADLVVRSGHAAVPGGVQFEPVWEKVVGTNPSRPREFFRELLRKDDGKMMAFFSCMMQLDSARQSFFSASVTRTMKFYELFKESPEVARRNRRTTPFQDFIAQVPLDSDLHIRFPGSPEVWMVAKGQSGSEQQTAKMLKKVSRIANQDTEDAILLRLARTAYAKGVESISELANFMAVVRVEAHRSEPLDEASALLLAQQHIYHRAIWQYVTGLTGLDFKGYTQLFRLGSKLHSLDIVTLGDVLGEFNSVAKLLCILQEFKRIDERQAASIFTAFCERLNQANSTKDFALSSLDSVREIIQAAGAPEKDFDAAIRDLLIKPSGPLSTEIRGNVVTFTGNQVRRDGYQRILEFQRVPSLNALYGMRKAADNLAMAKGTLADSVKQLNDNLATIQQVEYSKSAGLRAQTKDSFLSFRLDKLQDIARNLAKASSKKKPNKKKIASLSQEFLSALNPQVRLALTGILYAFYFRPSDLLVSEDPSFLRRHQFVPFDLPRETSVYSFSSIEPDEKAGSFLRGGFGDMSVAVSKASMATSRRIQDAAKPFAAEVLGSVKDTEWQALKDEDLRITGLRVLAAREWIIRSSSDSTAMSELASSLEGMLSAGRRANLLRAIKGFQWELAWKMVSAGELFFLGEQYLARFRDGSEESPVIAALRSFSSGNNLSNLHWLGPELNSIYECSHPHLLELPSFEHFENFTFPDKIAERSNEYMLYLAELADRAGVSSAVLEHIAEPMALRLFSEVRMTGLKDWQSVIKAYSSMNDTWITEASPK